MKKGLLFICLILNLSLLTAQQIAFSGAEGFGKYAIGGREGTAYHVTNLNDSGPGSFRDAVSQPRRTVVFDVSGIIKINSRLSVESFITIDGSTAPKDGITVYGNGVSFSGSNDVIVRYMRFRGSAEMGRGVCTVSADNASDIIFDHVSIEWGRWDNLHIKDSKNITLQYCLIAEGINPQMFGALLENPVNLTIDHCLWIDNQSRNPKAKAGIEIINNVIYNWRTQGLVGGHSAKDHYQDVINNYFIAGPNSSDDFIGMFTQTDHVYQKGNIVDLNKNGKLDGRLVTGDDFTKIGAALEAKPNNSSLSLSKIEKPEDAFKKVLDQAGASLHRDDVDNRLVGYVRTLGKEGMIAWANAEIFTKIDPIPFADNSHHWYDIFDKGNMINPMSGRPRFKPDEITSIADNILLLQKSNGGWPKNYDVFARLTDSQKDSVKAAKNVLNTTFDNGSTYNQIAALSDVYTVTKVEKYKIAALRGLDFIVKSQYKNGGWPQYYPLEKNYSRCITYNDGAMKGIMVLLKDIKDGKPQYSFVSKELREKLVTAYDKGLECILKTQINDAGKPTAWCQQYDEVSLEPAWARKYESPSICNRESADLVIFLMSIDNPKKEIIDAVQNAVSWFQESKIYNTRIKTISAQTTVTAFRVSVSDRVIENDSTAPPIWARYYELKTHRPIFCNRDSKIVYSLAEVARERRDGYGWYVYDPQQVLDKYPEWQKKWTKY